MGKTNKEELEELLSKSMSPGELNRMLLDKVPEISEKFKEETSWQDGMDTGSHLVFEDVLSFFVLDHADDKELMTRIFDFIEELLDLDDFYALNVVTVSFIESIVYRCDPRCYFEFMHPKTMQITQEYLEEKLGPHIDVD